MTVIKTVRKGWTEQYGLMVYELVASVDGTEYRKTSCVTDTVYQQHGKAVELAVRQDLTKEITAKHEQS